jgi:hypothetical protein
MVYTYFVRCSLKTKYPDFLNHLIEHKKENKMTKAIENKKLESVIFKNYFLLDREIINNSLDNDQIENLIYTANLNDLEQLDYKSIIVHLIQDLRNERRWAIHLKRELDRVNEELWELQDEIENTI